jgi:Flp pilus assembly pilin Flp
MIRLRETLMEAGEWRGSVGVEPCRWGASDHRAGQSIVEYLVVVTVIVALLLAFRDPLRGAVDNLYNAATAKINDAASRL